MQPPWPTKSEVSAAFPNMSEGQAGALGNVVRDLRNWQSNPASGWFGESINPDQIVARIRELARKYHLDPEYMMLATYPAMKRAGAQ